MKKFLSILSLLAFIGCNRPSAPYVLLVSFDGFRYDYVDKYDLGNFKQFIAEGSKAEALIPSFPTLTFPNHYSIVTGLYPGHHGIVSNRFIDRVTGRSYSMDNQKAVTDAYFYKGIPLWQLAHQNGLKSASYFWVGSEAPIEGVLPNYTLPYNDSTPNEERVATVLSWLQKPEEERPHFISLYFALVDHAGHSDGPNSEHIRKEVKEADRIVGLLTEGLKKTGLPVNVIIVSDHGMYEMINTDSTLVVLNEILPDSGKGFQLATSSNFSQIYIADTTRREAAYRVLSKDDRCDVFRRSEFPAEFHFDDTSRVGDLAVMARPGHYLVNSRGGKPAKSAHWGSHGFDPRTTPEMNGIFYAAGPNIRKGITVPKFENVNVYPFIAQILNLPIPPIDGDPRVLRDLIAH